MWSKYCSAWLQSHIPTQPTKWQHVGKLSWNPQKSSTILSPRKTTHFKSLPFVYACCTIKPNLKCISLKTCDTFGVFFSFQKLLQRYDHRLKCWNQDSSLYFGSTLNSSVIHWMECTSVIQDYTGNDSILKTEHLIVGGVHESLKCSTGF